jgi:hypothetical protein
MRGKGRVKGGQAHLGDTVGVSEDDTDLGRGETLSSELEDVVADLLGRGLEPRRSGSLVRQSRGGDTLSGSVHSSRAQDKKVRC